MTLKLKESLLVLAVVMSLTDSDTVELDSTDVGRRPMHLSPDIVHGRLSEARTKSLITHAVIPRSHAGVITVNTTYGNHLFFWLFPALNENPHAPLMVWLNDGPGFSSMEGLFFENGPLRISENYELTRWNKTWAQNISMLYIDQPVGAGYSYTQQNAGRRFNQEGCTADLYEFMKQFYSLFPEYQSRDLYIGGQSYAGKFVPAFAYHLHTEIRANRSNIPLRGIYLGSALFDVRTQLSQSARFYQTIGAISKKQADDFRANFDRSVNEGRLSILNYQSNNTFPVVSWNRDNYLTLENKVSYSLVEKAFKNTYLANLIHINYTFAYINREVETGFNQDLMVSQASNLAHLMDNYKVLIYNGDVSGSVNSVVLDAGIMALNWSRQAEYNNTVRQIWGPANDPKGYYSLTGQFCRVVVRKAGDRVPLDQPDVSRDMIYQFIQFGCITTSN